MFVWVALPNRCTPPLIILKLCNLEHLNYSKFTHSKTLITIDKKLIHSEEYSGFVLKSK